MRAPGLTIYMPVALLSLLPVAVVWAPVAWTQWAIHSSLDSDASGSMGAVAVVFVLDDVDQDRLAASWTVFSRDGLNPLVLCKDDGRVLVLAKERDPIFAGVVVVRDGMLHLEDDDFQKLLASLGLGSWFYWHPFPNSGVSGSIDSILERCEVVYLVARAGRDIIVRAVLKEGIMEPGAWLASEAYASMSEVGLRGRLLVVLDYSGRNLAVSITAFYGTMQAAVLYGAGLAIAVLLISSVASSRGSIIISKARRKAFLHMASGRSRVWVLLGTISAVIGVSVIAGLLVAVSAYIIGIPLGVMVPALFSTVVYSGVAAYSLMRGVIDESLGPKGSALLALAVGVTGALAAATASGWRPGLNVLLAVDLPLVAIASLALATFFSRLLLRGLWVFDVVNAGSVAATLLVGAVLAAAVGASEARGLSEAIADMVAPELPYAVAVPGARPGAGGYLASLSGVSLRLPDGEEVHVGYGVLDNVDLTLYVGRGFGGAVGVPDGVDVAVIIYNYESPGDGEPDLSWLARYNLSEVLVSAGSLGLFNASLIVHRVGAPPYYFIEYGSVDLIVSYPHLPFVQRHITVYFRDAQALLHALKLPEYAEATIVVAAPDCSRVGAAAAEAATRAGAEDYIIIGVESSGEGCKARVSLLMNTTLVRIASLPYPYSFYSGQHPPPGVNYIDLASLRAIIIGAVRASLPEEGMVGVGAALAGLGVLAAYTAGAAAASQVELEVAAGSTRLRALLARAVLPALAAYTGSAAAGLVFASLAVSFARIEMTPWLWALLAFSAALTGLASLAGAALNTRG